MEASAVGDLVLRARDGDQRAWDALVERYLGMVHAVCRGQHLRPDAAAEVDQVVWLRLVEHLDRIHAPEAVGGWIAATARNECLRQRRVAENTVPAGDGHGLIDTGLLVYERDRAVTGAFGRLGDRCRQLVRLLMADPTPDDDEVAAALDMPAASVGPARGRCLEQLRQMTGVGAGDPVRTVADWPADDELLVAELRRAAGLADPVPDGWRAAARAAFSWHALSGRPARLVYDSRAAGPRQVDRGLPGSEVQRTLRFAAGGRLSDAGIELDVDVGADKVRITGRLRPGRSAPVTVLHDGGRVDTEAAADGAFGLDELPRRPFCLVVGGADGLKTGWVIA